MKDEIILMTREPVSLLSLSWEGEINILQTQTFSEMENDASKIKKLTRLIPSNSDQIIGWITQEGDAWLATRIKNVSFLVAHFY